MGAPHRFFFLHLQKTGGTALFQRLRDGLGASAVYPTPDDQGDVRAVLDVGHLTARVPSDGSGPSVITGHFPLCVVEVLGGPFTTFTVLRDPVERTLSLLRRRQAADERFLGHSLEQIYADPALQDIIRNHMVKMLSLTVDEMGTAPLAQPVVFDAARLARAQQNLADRIDCFGFQEHFDDFCRTLEDRFGWDLGAPRVANRTPHGPVPDGLRERIAADNDMDVELYRFAVALADERKGSGGTAGG
jgi:hypothetical protein